MKTPLTVLKRSVAAAILGSWVLGAWAFGLRAFGNISSQQAARVDFGRDVRPLLIQHCIGCHGPSQQMHGLRLDRRRDAMRGGTLPMIVPGDSGASRLYLKLIGAQYGPQMPPTGPLANEQIAIIKAWIDGGADWPDDLAGDSQPPPADPRATRAMELLRAGDKSHFLALLHADPAIAKLKGPGGTTPLMQAVLYGDQEELEFLLASGADPNARNDAGATALMWAVGDAAMTRTLLEHGADVNARSDYGRTPLLIAAGQAGAGEVMKLLLDRGADLTAKSPLLNGWATPLSEAASTGDEARLRLLIQHGADVNQGGLQMLPNAYRTGCKVCFETLLERADRATRTKAALLLAQLPGDNGELETLLQSGVDANTRDAKGNTLLILAAGSDGIKVKAAKTLIDRGADVNAQNNDGKSALDFARLRGPTPVVGLLVKSGARNIATAAEAGSSPKPATSVRAALARTIPLLQQADATFLKKTGCVSCHTNSLTAMTIAAARAAGAAFDKESVRSQSKIIGSYIESFRERALLGVATPGESDTIGYILVGLAAADYPPDPATDALARYLKSKQQPDGHWRIRTHRPPLESSDIQVTATCLRSLRVYGPGARRREYEAAARLAADWLITAQPQTTEDRAFQLLGLKWAGERPDDRRIQQAMQDLIDEQHPDGGWSQLPTMQSDAYATGQALVALIENGALSLTSQVYKKALAFLLGTQFEDGSWHVRGRAIPAQPFFEGGFPHGRDQFISAAATNWAAMAMASYLAPLRKRQLPVWRPVHIQSE